MKLHRKLALALAAPLAASGLLLASPAQAADADVCALAGYVTLSNGVDIVTDQGVGTYDFVSTVLVCAGTVVTGAGTVDSDGNYSGPNFSGTFSGLGCTGSVSGSRKGGVVTATATVNCPTASASGNFTCLFTPDPRATVGTRVYGAFMQCVAPFVAL